MLLSLFQSRPRNRCFTATAWIFLLILIAAARSGIAASPRDFPAHDRDVFQAFTVARLGLTLHAFYTLFAAGLRGAEVGFS